MKYNDLIKITLEPGTYYHIYNRANGSENLFRKAENYRYFLRQWDKYISPVAVSLAYCLMPNHFHFLVRVREEAELAAFFEKRSKSKRRNNHLSKGFKPLERLGSDYNKQISRQFSHLFNSYAQAYNKMFNRRGSLFMQNFKKKEITSDEYLLNVVAYIHLNPVRHGFVTAAVRWPHSSYTSIINGQPTVVNTTALIECFGNKPSMISYHQQAELNLQEFEKQYP